MNKRLKCAAVLLFIILCIQLIVTLWSYNKGIKKDIAVNNINVNALSLKIVYNSIGCNKNKRILSAEKNSEGWNLKIAINGDAKFIKNEVQKLKNYTINSYSIDKKESENTVILDILYENNVKKRL